MKKKTARAQTLIQQTINPKFLAKLIRRANIRYRPLWKKNLIRTFLTTYALFLFCCLYTFWFATGKPNVTIDYVARLNQIARPDAPDNQNAWSQYQNAIDKYMEPNETLNEIFASTRLGKVPVSLASLSVNEQKAIDDWINRNEPAWAEYLTASNMGHFWYDYNSGTADQDNQMLTAVLMLPLEKMKALSKLGIWKARLLMERGDIHNALDHCLAVIRTGRHLQVAPIILEQLVGISNSHMAHEEILHIISDAKLTASQLTYVQNQLTAVYKNKYPALNFAIERLVHLDTVQRLFTDSGPGGGRLRPNSWNKRSLRGVIATMTHAGRHKTLKEFNIIDDMVENDIRLTPWQLHTTKDKTAKDYLNSLPKVRYLIVHKLYISVNRASEMVWRSRALHEAILTVLALNRWSLQKGSYPESLGELVEAGLLERLPLDPYRDGPLTYKKQGDDFILYSYAGDFDDDGGHQTPKDPWPKKEAGGDHLFWPRSY